MAKNAKSRQSDFHDQTDFMDGEDFSFYEEDEMSVMLAHVLENNRHQLEVALELTKIIYDKKSASDVSEEKVFQTFQKAMKTINENSPLKPMLEKMT